MAVAEMLLVTSLGRTLAALLFAALAHRAAATTRIPQNMDKNLLNIIKDNLRRHNDDYSDRSTVDDLNGPHPSRHPNNTRGAADTASSPTPLSATTARQAERRAERRAAAGKAARTRTTPRADILDMAPAKGSRINAKREKGRLCQRHVLLPEGPKYDSWGTAYLLAHSGRRPFPATRAPRLLLPACCNCCKKSVLGCE